VAEVETPERVREFRRAVYFNTDAEAGTVAGADNLITLRPNAGIDSREYFALLGRRLRVRKKAFEPVSWSDFETDDRR
jgi:sialic acid synthase SpsE